MTFSFDLYCETSQNLLDELTQNSTHVLFPDYVLIFGSDIYVLLTSIIGSLSQMLACLLHNRIRTQSHECDYSFVYFSQKQRRVSWQSSWVQWLLWDVWPLWSCSVSVGQEMKRVSSKVRFCLNLMWKFGPSLMSWLNVFGCFTSGKQTFNRNV